MDIAPLTRCALAVQGDFIAEFDGLKGTVLVQRFAPVSA
jgi:hypothetical protein